jgi:hypothetical protein
MTTVLEELVSQVQNLTVVLPDVIKNVSSLSQDQFLLEFTRISICRQSLEGIMDALVQIRASKACSTVKTDPDSDESFVLDAALLFQEPHVASDRSHTESDESIVFDAPPIFQEDTEEQDSLKMVYRHGKLLFASTGQFVSII